MTKKDYLTSLLALCTDKQKALFNRLYPEFPQPSQVKHAIFQIENTLKKLNEVNEDFNNTLNELQEFKKAADKKYYTLDVKFNMAKQELEEAERHIDRLNNPIDIDNAEVQERLDLLDALIAGGVDNWQWYDESISNFNSNR